MNYQCPICGYRKMPYAAVPYNICPCCGTEFGVDDRLEGPRALRKDWILKGMLWFDDITSPDKDWSPVLQLISAGFGGELLEANGHGVIDSREEVPVGTANWWIPTTANNIVDGVTYAQAASVFAL